MLATVITSSLPNVAVGSRLVVGCEQSPLGSTGDAELDRFLVAQASDLGARKRRRCLTWREGAVEVFVEALTPPDEMVICGAGHIAVPLAVMATQAGFRVTVIDDRPRFANVARFPTAHRVIAAPFDEALAKTRITRSTAVVLVTRGHRHDWECLRRLIREPAFYLGMIGSRRRVRAARMGLEREGVVRERLEAIWAPIGLDIGAETPEEIAVAILAEIVLVRRGGSGVPLSRCQGGADGH
jgi:xanthine dehydrogenase accessory factor